MKVVEDLNPSDIQKGINGKPFEIKLLKNNEEDQYFEIGDVIKYDKTNKIELIILSRYHINIQTITHVCKIITNNPDDFLDNRFLKPGTYYFKYR